MANKFDFLYSGNPIENYDLDICLEEAAKADELIHQMTNRLAIEVLKLRHELNDASYQYAGSRIHRAALITRNAQIDKLQEEIKQLKAK